VIFIDDANAILEDGEERGLYRYLLTMLDGLESEGTARVCVMMTAMNLAIGCGHPGVFLQTSSSSISDRSAWRATQAHGRGSSGSG
jgi:hypothetical protein